MSLPSYEDLPRTLKAGGNETCCVCFEDCDVFVRMLCMHELCVACAQKWFGGQRRTTCPLCRMETVDNGGMVSVWQNAISNSGIRGNIFAQYVDTSGVHWGPIIDYPPTRVRVMHNTQRSWEEWEADVDLVVSQTNVSRAVARSCLIRNGGDIVDAIMEIAP